MSIIREISKLETFTKSKERILPALALWLWKWSKTFNLCVKKTENKHVDFLFIGGEGKTDYVLIKSLNTFLYECTLHLGRKHFHRYNLQCFGTVETITCQIKDCFKTIDKQGIKLPKKANILD